MNDLLSKDASAPLGSRPVADAAQQLWQQCRQGPPPALEDLLTHTRKQSTAELVAVLQVDQRERWHRGERILVEDYVRSRPSLCEDEEALLDLVYSELLVREEVGEPASLREYLERFPYLGPQIERQLALHEALEEESLAQCDLTPLDDRKTGGVSANAPVPERIGKYLIVAALAEGGQGTVYRAVHPSLGKEVALKWSRLPLDPGSGQRDLLLAEGRILADLDHPSLARVYDMDVHENRAFVVLEYVPGRNLEQFARQEASSPSQAAVLVARVARAVAAAHQRGIVHRDIKPRNILIDETGRPRLIDFGMARVEHAWGENAAEFGHLLGTVQYMAPEQAMSLHGAVGPRTDIFALGGVLFFLLTGRAPSQGVTFQATLERAQQAGWDQGALAAAKTPRRLEAICRRALAKRPEDRYARAEDLAADLEAFARPRGWQPWILRGAALLLGMAGLIGLAGWGAGWWLPADSEPTSLERDDSGARATGVQPFDLSLLARVWRKDRYLDLASAAPLRPGDELAIQREVAAHRHASLFLFTSDGRVKRLAVLAPADRARILYFPEQENRSAPLTGPPGIEMFLVCTSVAGPIDEKDVGALWSGAGSWSWFPEKAVLRMEPGRIRSEEQSRDVGPTRPRSDPEGQARRKLEKLRLQLRERFEDFEGLVFFHR